ncbi:MAG: hypothetical protein HQM08_11605 [Candidatus Riflebacteria bacterium]|nr:hypothetical protein [Candidatus Riflebacteria bacterium]
MNTTLYISFLRSPVSKRGTYKPTIGFTLMEIIFGAAVLSLLMLGVLAIYRSGSESFIIGTWKVTAQKKAQMFLAQLRDDLEKANNPLELGTSTVVFPTASTAIYLNNDAFSTNETASFTLKYLDSNTWIPLAFLTISKPFCQATVINNNVRTPGKWMGVSIWATANKIRYIRTGDVNTFSSVPGIKPSTVLNFLPNSGTIAAGGDWEPSTEGIFDQELIQDVRKIGFMKKLRNTDGTPKVVIQTRIHLQRYKNGAPAETIFTEDMDAKIQEWTKVETF